AAAEREEIAAGDEPRVVREAHAGARTDFENAAGDGREAAAAEIEDGAGAAQIEELGRGELRGGDGDQRARAGRETDRVAISAASRPSGRGLSPHGPGGSRAQWSARSAVQGSRISGERRGPAA